MPDDPISMIIIFNLLLPLELFDHHCMFRACIEHLITRQIDKLNESFNLVTIVRVQLKRKRKKKEE